LEAPFVLTTRQQEIWNFLVEYVDRHGYPPTVREIGEHVGLASPSTVHAHLANLERAGLLRRDPTKPRALELIGRERRDALPAGPRVEQNDVTRLPLVGQIAAGGPLLAEQHIEEYVPMPSSMKGDFLLRVQGESMIDAGILDGDHVVVRQQEDARDGEIVVAGIPGEEATVKTLRRDGREIVLVPSNPRLEPMRFPADQVTIFGKVVTVLRRL
jgi:repressor LexA